MTLQQPLFMQAGKYTAAADRHLIGATLYPKGGPDQNPRPGVRPFGTVSTTDSTEMSFLVTRPTGTGFTVGDVIVDEGVAFVAGPASQTLNGVYLVVNSGPQTVNVGGGGSGARTVELYLQILDAEHGGTPDMSTASAVFTVRDTSVPGSTAPVNSLFIALISLDSGGAVGTITDKRTYTTMHGGTVIVAAATELTAAPMSNLPLGFTAYSLAEMATYTRTLDGWQTISVLHVAKTRPQDAKVPSGYLFFDTDTNTEEIFVRSGSGATTTAGWYTMGRVDGRARLLTSGAYPAGNPRHAGTSSNAWSSKLAAFTVSNEANYKTLDKFIPTSHGQPGGPVNPAPGVNDMSIRFQVFGDKTIVTAVLSFEIAVRKADYNFDDSGIAEVILNIRKYATPGGGATASNAPVTTTNNAIDYNLTAEANPWIKAGMRATHRQDLMKSRTIVYQLSPGEYYIEPKACLTAGNADQRIIQFYNVTVDVVL